MRYGRQPDGRLERPEFTNSTFYLKPNPSAVGRFAFEVRGAGLFEIGLDTCEWCRENLKGGWHITMYHVHIDNEDDAFAFKMRWC